MSRDTDRMRRMQPQCSADANRSGAFTPPAAPIEPPKPARSEVSLRVRSQTSPMRQVPTLVAVMVLASAVVASQTQ